MNLKISYDLSSEDHASTRERLDRLDALMADQPEASSSLIARATERMIELHWNQSPRPDGAPYVDHPLDVAIKLVQDFGFTEPAVVAAALLHDSVEDQADKLAGIDSAGGSSVRDAAVKRLAEDFGKYTAKLVACVTNPNCSHLKTRRQKNSQYRRHFKAIAKTNPVAYAIKLADFSTNALQLLNLIGTKHYARLRTKYRYVNEDAMDFLNQVADTGDVLSAVKLDMLPRLNEAAQVLQKKGRAYRSGNLIRLGWSTKDAPIYKTGYVIGGTFSGHGRRRKSSEV